MTAFIFNTTRTYSSPEEAVKAIRESWNNAEQYAETMFELHAFAIKPTRNAEFSECSYEYCILYSEDEPDGAWHGVGEAFLQQVEAEGALGLEDYHYVALFEYSPGRFEVQDFGGDDEKENTDDYYARLLRAEYM